jgi:hypothetical protein
MGLMHLARKMVRAYVLSSLAVCVRIFALLYISALYLFQALYQDDGFPVGSAYCTGSAHKNCCCVGSFHRARLRKSLASLHALQVPSSIFTLYV